MNELPWGEIGAFVSGMVTLALILWIFRPIKSPWCWSCGVNIEDNDRKAREKHQNYMRRFREWMKEQEHTER